MTTTQARCPECSWPIAPDCVRLGCPDCECPCLAPRVHAVDALDAMGTTTAWATRAAARQTPTTSPPSAAGCEVDAPAASTSQSGADCGDRREPWWRRIWLRAAPSPRPRSKGDQP